MNERIKKLRKALALTQQEFANHLGIRQNTIAKYETNRGTPTRAVIALICREFRVNEEWLRTGSGDMFQQEPKDELDRLVTEYGLPQEFRTLAEEFLDLKPDERKVVLGFVQKLAAKLTAESTAEPVDQHAIWEAEARAEAEEYYQEILEEKKQQARESAFLDYGGDLLA